METDTLTAPDAEEASMRELGIQTDASEGRQVETPEPTPPVEAQEQAPEPETPEAETPDQTPEVPEPGRDHPQQRPRDPTTGKFQKPDTEYSKAVKEQARIARSWQQIQAEKEQYRTEKAQWEEQVRMQQLEAIRQQFQPLKKDGLTAKQYYDGAQVFERDGDHENALKAYKVASEMSHIEQQRYQQYQQADQEYQWRQQLDYVRKIEPSVFDPNTPIGAHTQRIIDGNPGLYNIPNGFLRAAEFAHMLTQIEEMKAIQDENIALKAELEKGRRRSQPSKGGFASPRTDEKDFDSMSLDEMESHLKGLTAEADNYR